MPGGVNGAGGAGNINPYLDIAKQTTGYIQNAGVDMSAVNSIMTYAQSPDAAINGVVDGALDAMGASPVTKAVISGAIDIGKTIVEIVLTGNYNTGADVKEAKQNGQEITNLTDTATQMSDATENADTTQKQGEIEAQSQELTGNLAQSVETITQVNEENEASAELMQENNEVIQENEQQIQQKQAQMEQLQQQISSLKGNAQANNADQGDGTGTEFIQANGAEGNPELKALIDQYNGLAADVAGLKLQNDALITQNVSQGETINENIEATQEQQTELVEITAEQSANIDAAANEIVSMCNSAEGAINEVKNMLAGNFPKMDQVTLVKLATAMTKSAICGTNSGLLATAASAMGVSSIFSFGATAGKAAQLTAAAGDQGAASAAHIAANAAGKLAQQAATAAVNQVLSNVSNLVGVDLNSLYSQMTQFIGENSEMLAQAKDTASQAQLQTQEELGIEGNNSGDAAKKPETENQTA